MNKIKRHLQTLVWIWILNKRHQKPWWFKTTPALEGVSKMISWWKPYKPACLDVEASRWPFGGRTSQFCRSVVGWGAKWFELLLNIIDFRWSKLLTTCCQNRSSYSRTYATASTTRPAFRSWMWVKFIYSEKATKFLRNLHLFLTGTSASQKKVEISKKFCGLLRIYELYISQNLWILGVILIFIWL